MERADAAGGSAWRWLCLEWQDLSEPVEGGLRDHRPALERAEILRPARQTGEGVLTMKAGSTKVVRCAIYTRVSTDQGLEQDFNSLDAPLFGSGSPALCRDDFVVGTAAGADAVGRFFADFYLEILRSVSRRRAALPKPHFGNGAGGAGSRGALGARN